MKSLFLSTLLFGSILVGEAMNSTSNLHHKKVALVLSGGGAQGLAHIGVLKAFEEYKVPIDLIVGTSSGALVGGLYASGVSVERLELLVKDGSIMKLFLGRNDLSDIPIWQRNNKSSGKFSIRRSDERISGPPGLLNDQLIWRDLFLLTAPANHLAESNFDSLFIPFRAIGADIMTQQTVVLDSGYLSEAMRISMSIPMIYPAVVKNGAILIDGGIYNNMPTDIARKLGADYIIAVNVDDTPPPIEKMRDIFDYFDLFSSVFFSPTDSVNISEWDYFINVDTKGFNIFDFSAGEALIERGYDAGSKAAKNIIETFERQENIEQMKIRRSRFQNALDGKIIEKIQWVEQQSEKIINNEYQMDTPFDYSPNNVRSIINSLYATNTYNLIIPNLSDNGRTLIFKVQKKATIQMIPEVKISSVNGFNLSGDWDYRFIENRFSLRSKVGIGNYQSDAEFTLSPNKFISPLVRHTSHLIWELKTFGNYQTFNDVNSNNNIYLFESGIGLSVHRLLSWDQQFIATINVHANRWVNLDDSLFPDYSRTIYPGFSLQYETNHIQKETPISEGWKMHANFISGLWDSNAFFGFKGEGIVGMSLKNKYFFSTDVSYQTMSEHAPLELTYKTNLSTAFINTLYVDTFSFSSLDISFNITHTFFRDDVFLSLKSYNTYLEDRILGLNDDWIFGADVSIKYESILGPIELGWSISDGSNFQVVSWTKLHIYL
jgi:predicted acylesterase/phospholipase RssA